MDNRHAVDDLLHGAPQNPFLRTRQCLPPGGVGCSGTWPCSAARSHLPELSILGPREVWCLYSDRAIATLIRAYFKYAR